MLGVGAVQFQESDEISAGVRVAYRFDDPPAVQIQTGQQRHRAQTLILVIPQVTGMPTHYGRAIGRGHGQSLNARLLVIRDRHHAQWALTRTLPSIFIDDFNLLVDVLHARHFDFERRIPPLHVVSNLVWPKLTLAQNLVEFGTTQLLQCRMAGGDAVLTHMGISNS